MTDNERAEVREYLCRRASEMVGRSFDRRMDNERSRRTSRLSWSAHYNVTAAGNEQIVETTIADAEISMEWRSVLGGFGFLVAAFSDAPDDKTLDLDAPCPSLEVVGEMIPADMPDAEL